MTPDIAALQETRDQWLQQAAKRNRDGRPGGTVTFRQCRFCGHLEWVSTSAEGPARIVVEPMNSIEGCRPCVEVSRRNPEIFDWVLNVVTHHRLPDVTEIQG